MGGPAKDKVDSVRRRDEGRHVGPAFVPHKGEPGLHGDAEREVPPRRMPGEANFFRVPVRVGVRN